jgi:hypothetical protein
MAMKFQNPANNYVETVSGAWWWSFLFGPLFFLVKGMWIHVILWIVLVVITCGFSWLIYPLFTNSIVSNDYMRRGWVRLPNGWY